MQDGDDDDGRLRRWAWSRLDVDCRLSIADVGRSVGRDGMIMMMVQMPVMKAVE